MRSSLHFPDQPWHARRAGANSEPSPPTRRKLSQFLGRALVSLSLVAATAPLASAAVAGEAVFQVVDGGWGGGHPDEIGKIIAAVANEFPTPVADGSPPRIRVRHRFGGPRIDYNRDLDGWIVVHLSARDDRWYQYVYQFAHEYCHLLSHFDRKQRGGEIQRDHQWFEESLCETASLYALRRSAAQWCDSADDPQLREAAPQLAQYVRQLLAEPHRRLEPSTDFSTWYTRNRQALQGEPYLRDLNDLAATQLLPLFERNPKRWAALAYLNPANPVPGQSFTDFLAAWSTASPSEFKPLVAEIQALFGVRPMAAAGGAIDALRILSPPQPGKEPGCGS
jgi:hypothetical protein